MKSSSDFDTVSYQQPPLNKAKTSPVADQSLSEERSERELSVEVPKPKKGRAKEISSA